MEYTDADGQNKLSDLIEAYLVNSSGKYFLCNSVEWKEYISSKLEDLYQIARMCPPSQVLDENARNFWTYLMLIETNSLLKGRQGVLSWKIIKTFFSKLWRDRK